MLLTVLIFQEKLEIQVFMKNLFKMLASNLYNGASLIAQRVKNLPTNAGDTGDMGSIPGWDDPLEEVMATYRLP